MSQKLHLYAIRSNSEKALILSQLQEAKTFWSRAVGLLGRQNPLTSEEGLWLIPGASIHTFFMKFSIDVVFLSKDMKVISTYSSVRPGRLIGHQWGAHSVVEMSAGKLNTIGIKKGDELHVGT